MQGVDSSSQKALFFFLLCGNQRWNLKQQCVSEPVSTGSVHEGLGDLVTTRGKKVQSCGNCLFCSKLAGDTRCGK